MKGRYDKSLVEWVIDIAVPAALIFWALKIIFF